MKHYFIYQLRKSNTVNMWLFILKTRGGKCSSATTKYEMHLANIHRHIFISLGKFLSTIHSYKHNLLMFICMYLHTIQANLRIIKFFFILLILQCIIQFC